MKSDVIHVTNTGVGTEDALAQADATAAFKTLDKKQSMHLRLLTEEMMSLVHALTGEKEADFWIETEKDQFQLHLTTITNMNSRKRSQLLSASTSGKNASAKGILGKFRDLLERSLEPVDDSLTNYYPSGWLYPGMDSTMIATTPNVWSFNQYRDSIGEESAPEVWDELEKSILAKLADEVTINIDNDIVNMVVFKTFN